MAADANVILSAVVGKAALKVFTRSSLEVVSTPTTLMEVREYLPKMAEDYGIALEILEGQLRLLAITEYAAREYKRFIPRAARRIGKRDPDDVELLALAFALGIPIWTNDRDFQGVGVECYTTARLLKTLGLRRALTLRCQPCPDPARGAIRREVGWLVGPVRFTGRCALGRPRADPTDARGEWKSTDSFYCPSAPS